MGNYSVNSCQKIVWVGNDPNNPSNIHEIEKVVYCDNNGNLHTVWPAKLELTDMYIVELGGSQSSDIAYPYTVDQNGMPQVLLKPGSAYAVKGTVKVYRDAGVEECTISNCYFAPETISQPDGPDTHLSPISGNGYQPYGFKRIATDNIGNQYEMDYYSAWKADTELGVADRLSLQTGFWNPKIGYVQSGFIFDSNYVTPYIFKRGTVYRGIHFYPNGATIPASPENASGNINYAKIPVGDTYVFNLKGYRLCDNPSWISNYDSDVTVSNISYDQTKVTVASSATSGQYSIHVTNPGINEVAFTCDGVTEKITVFQSDLSINPSQVIDVSWNGDLLTIDLIAFTSWTASTTDEWINIHNGSTSGEGSNPAVEIGVLRNNSSSVRTGHVIFTSSNNETVTLTITQGSNPNPPSVNITAYNWKNNDLTNWINRQSINVTFSNGTWNGVTMSIKDTSNNTIMQLISTPRSIDASSTTVELGMPSGKINDIGEWDISDYPEGCAQLPGADVDSGDYIVYVSDGNGNSWTKNFSIMPH